MTKGEARKARNRIDQVYRWIQEAKTEQDLRERILAASKDENEYVRDWVQTRWRATLAVELAKKEAR